MIAHEKTLLIEKEGTTVTVYPVNKASFVTKTLIGKMSKQTTISMDDSRRAYFKAGTDIVGGYIVKNNNEYLLAVSTFNEQYKEDILSIGVFLYKCNTVITIKGLSDTYDQYGNRSAAPSNKLTNGKGYLQTVNATLRQYDPGIHPDAKYIIYVPYCSVSIMDTVDISTEELDLKVVDVNNFVNPGVSVIQVRSETRNV